MRFGGLGFGVRLAALLAIAAACSNGSSPDEPCPNPAGQADFIVTITAGEELLPPDTNVKVRFGSGEEEFSLAQNGTLPEVLFCDRAGRDGGTVDAGAGGPAEALNCELFTAGSADLEVRATGYESLSKRLTAKPLPDHCGLGVITQRISVDLEPIDGGS